jgi:hypothetical protein
VERTEAGVCCQILLLTAQVLAFSVSLTLNQPDVKENRLEPVDIFLLLTNMILAFCLTNQSNHEPARGEGAQAGMCTAPSR